MYRYIKQLHDSMTAWKWSYPSTLKSCSVLAQHISNTQSILNWSNWIQRGYCRKEHMILSRTKLKFPHILKQNYDNIILHFALSKMLLVVHCKCLPNLKWCQLTYQPWNQKFRYFFYLLNPSVGTKRGCWHILLSTT